MIGDSGGLYYGELDKNDTTMSLGGGDQVLSGFAPATGEFQKIQSVLVDGGDRYGVNTVAMDSYEELVWMGNQGGHVTSYYGSNLEKYTSFQVVNNEEIRQILPLEELVLILSQTQLRGQIRRGLPIFTHASENLQEMQCMLQTSPTSVLLGGHQEFLVDFDLQQNVEISTMHIGESGCAILRNHARYICAGEPTGQIHLMDNRTFRKEQSVEAHSGSLSDFDVHGNVVVTCGFSSRHGTLTVDRFLKVYDLRVLRALAPISVSIDPYLLRFLPSFSSRIVAVSPTGQMEVLETQALSSANFSVYQVTADASMCQALDVSSSCHHVAVGDSAGTLHLFSSNPTAQFNSFSRDTEFPDPTEPLPVMSYTDEISVLSSIPFQLTNSALLSDWPAFLCLPVFRKAPEIHSEILQSMKMVGTIGYAPNPGLFSRNQIPYKSVDGSSETSAKIPIPNQSPTSGSRGRSSLSPVYSPQFTNKQFINQSTSPHRGNFSNTFGRGASVSSKHNYHLQSAASSKGGFPLRFAIPKRYCRLEWKKNSFEEGDMEPFNKTKFSGLEAATANSYCNALLQILYHIDFLRGSLISHLCSKEACLSCELGFLFHMIDESKIVPCVGNNFLRAFRVVPEASALGLILQESQCKQRSLFLRLIQSWNRFILHQIVTDFETGNKLNGKSNSNVSSNQKCLDPVSKMFAMQQDNINRCTRCGREEKKETTVFLSNLLYPPEGAEPKRMTFTSILQRSLCPEQTTPAWCDQCRKYQSTFQSRSPKSLPPVLSLNTCLDNAHDLQIWKRSMESMLHDKPIVDTMTLEGRGCSGVTPGVKSCRYGRNCMRPDCKFWHEGRTHFKAENAKMTDFDVNPDFHVKWLPSIVRIDIDDSKRIQVTDMDTKVTESVAPPDKAQITQTAEYQLIAVVCFVRDPELEEKSNLVAMIKVDPVYFDRKGQHQSKTGWFLFNDFCIREIPMSEANSFNPKWKLPCVVYYRKVEVPEELRLSPPIQNNITVDVFKESKYKELEKSKKANYIPLKQDEIPQKGELVAMDAEFVTLGQEETELRSDGKLATVKQQQLTVARVTCIRGQGAMEGVPFLDDYVSTQEVVVDYLTKFSGIQPGDLDANFSSKNVTMLKSVYLKLRFLVDSGVKFVGHGLNNDFRVINLVVPPDQVIDTVTLFYLPNQRMISLRFLAWHFLGLVIQSDMHDSAEDARAALCLYRKYEEIKKSGKLDQALEDLYEAGKKAQWKVPNESDK